MRIHIEAKPKWKHYKISTHFTVFVPLFFICLYMHWILKITIHVRIYYIHIYIDILWRRIRVRARKIHIQHLIYDDIVNFTKQLHAVGDAYCIIICWMYIYMYIKDIFDKLATPRALMRSNLHIIHCIEITFYTTFLIFTSSQWHKGKLHKKYINTFAITPHTMWHSCIQCIP